MRPLHRHPRWKRCLQRRGPRRRRVQLQLGRAPTENVGELAPNRFSLYTAAPDAVAPGAACFSLG